MEFGRCILRRIPNCQLGGDGDREIYPGNPSPTSIRNYTRFSKKNQVKLRCCFKISCTSIAMYDILKHALAIYLGSAAVRETILLAEPPIKDFTDARIDYSKNENKTQHFFIFYHNFCPNPVGIQQI